MLEDINLISRLDEINSELNLTIDQYNTQGEILADKEKEYNVLLRQKALIEKDAGMSVTFIDKFLRGDEEVAEKRRQRDIAEARYKTLQEKINYLKLTQRILDAQISREWSTRQGGY